jgi:hypothetical protein
VPVSEISCIVDQKSLNEDKRAGGSFVVVRGKGALCFNPWRFWITLERRTIDMAVKGFKLWIVNVLSFFLFSLLGVTGLINWLLLPRGHGSNAGFLASFRHFLITMHEWTGLLFMIIIGIHIALHWGYVRKNLERYRKQ